MGCLFIRTLAGREFFPGETTACNVVHFGGHWEEKKQSLLYTIKWDYNPVYVFDSKLGWSRLQSNDMFLYIFDSKLA